MNKQQMKEHIESEIARLDEKIASFDMGHDNINGFISNNNQLRILKQRRQGFVNALNSSVFA